MDKQKILLNNKLVWPSEPYKPNPAMMSVFVGREKEMELIMSAWIAHSGSLPLAPVLVGDPGVGKNRIIYELAKFTHRDLYLLQGHEDLSAEDLACTVRFSDDRANQMEYVLSPLVCAMMTGSLLFLDEIAKIRPRALALLVSVLDERRYIDSTLLGMRIYAQPGFRFISASNTGELGLLPEFIRSRMRPVIKVGYPPRQEIDEIIQRQFKRRMANLTALLEKYWHVWDSLGSDQTPPTPRDAIAAFSMASSLSDFESRDGREKLKSTGNSEPFSMDAGDNQTMVSADHLETAIREIFGGHAA